MEAILSKCNLTFMTVRSKCWTSWMPSILWQWDRSSEQVECLVFYLWLKDMRWWLNVSAGSHCCWAAEGPCPSPDWICRMLYAWVTRKINCRSHEGGGSCRVGRGRPSSRAAPLCALVQDCAQYKLCCRTNCWQWSPGIYLSVSSSVIILYHQLGWAAWCRTSDAFTEIWCRIN